MNNSTRSVTPTPPNTTPTTMTYTLRNIRRVISSPDVPPFESDVASSGGQKILRMIFMKKLDHWDEDGK